MACDSQMPEALRKAEEALRRTGRNREDTAWELLHTVNENAASIQPLTNLKAEVGLHGDEMEKLLLWYAAQRALQHTANLRVVAAVRIRLEENLRTVHMLNDVGAGTYALARAAKIATLRRFPAGPLEWEVSGIPRSYFLQARFPANLRFLAFALIRLKGLSPCFFLHVAPAPRNRALSVPKEVLRTYHRVVRSLERQPEIRGVLAHAWFHDPAAVRDNPQLDVLNRPFLDHGGLITLLAPAPASSGVVVGNAQRRADYEAGQIQYRYGFAMWPRAAALRWAELHPELSD